MARGVLEKSVVVAVIPPILAAMVAANVALIRDLIAQKQLTMDHAQDKRHPEAVQKQERGQAHDEENVVRQVCVIKHGPAVKRRLLDHDLQRLDEDGVHHAREHDEAREVKNDGENSKHGRIEAREAEVVDRLCRVQEDIADVMQRHDNHARTHIPVSIAHAHEPNGDCVVQGKLCEVRPSPVEQQQEGRGGHVEAHGLSVEQVLALAHGRREGVDELAHDDGAVVEQRRGPLRMREHHGHEVGEGGRVIRRVEKVF